MLFLHVPPWWSWAPRWPASREDDALCSSDQNSRKRRRLSRQLSQCALLLATHQAVRLWAKSPAFWPLEHTCCVIGRSHRRCGAPARSCSHFVAGRFQDKSNCGRMLPRGERPRWNLVCSPDCAASYAVQGWRSTRRACFPFRCPVKKTLYARVPARLLSVGTGRINFEEARTTTASRLRTITALLSSVGFHGFLLSLYTVRCWDAALMTTPTARRVTGIFLGKTPWRSLRAGLFVNLMRVRVCVWCLM